MSSPPPPTFKKRKPKLNTASSTSNAAAPPASDSEEDQGPAVVVRSRGARSNGTTTTSARRTKPSKPLSFTDTVTQHGESSIKRSTLSQGVPRLLPTASPLPSLSSSSSAAAATEAASSYSPAALAALKAATPTRSKLLQDTLDADGDVSMDDTPLTAVSAVEMIPSAARVQEAKERRRRAAANGRSLAVRGGEDFISLGTTSASGGNYAGPHPHSTLQREEDDLGDGSEDHAAYTGALERVALGDEARAREVKETKAMRRRAMEELGQGSESEESAQEWEREQLKKMGLVTSHVAREPSPYRAATIPAIPVLPSLTSASTRLNIRLVELDEAVKAHAQVRDDAARGLTQLQDEEAINKHEVERAGEAEAWFRELESFILAVATFLESKTPALEAIEKEATAILAERTRLIQRVRTTAATDEVCLFYGVPSVSLLPPAQAEDGTAMVEPSPAEEGEALSAVRTARRAGASTLEEVDETLSRADEAAFDAAWTRLALQLDSIFDDVAAPEFRSPAASHPAALVRRFTAWRDDYADEYAGAWGGLALASAWEFWARKEMGTWDAFRVVAQHGQEKAARGPSGLDGFEWHAQLSAYAEQGPQPPIGGDEEAVGNVVTSVVVPMLVKRAEAGAYNVWSASETKGAIELVEQVGYVLERTGARFQSLVSAHLASFKQHIASLHTALTTPPTYAAPGFHPLAPPARLVFLRRLLVLLRNLSRWNRYVTPPERPAYAHIADTLVGAVMWPLLVEARETGGREVAKEIMGAVPPTLLAKDVTSRLSGLAAGGQ